MAAKTFIKQYQQFLNRHADEQRAQQEKAYLYSDLNHYGVSVWQMRKFLSRHKKSLKDLSKPEVLSLVENLWNLSSHEERTMALLILTLYKDKITINDMPLIERLMRESRGWALLDNLIIPLMPEVIKKNKKGYDYLKKWITDNDFWIRRSALLAQLLFFRQDKNGDRELFFKMARSQFDEAWIDEVYQDTQDRKRARFFIRKAIGWVLREMSRQKPEPVVAFLKKHRPEMAGLTWREASKKLPPLIKKQLD